MGAEIHGRAEIQQKPCRNFTVFVIHPYMGRLQTGSDVPVDVTNIVVILVLTQLGQIQPKTAKQSLVIAMKQPIQSTNHGPFQSPQDVFSARTVAYAMSWRRF